MQKENRFFFSFSNGSNFPEGESYNIFANNNRFCNGFFYFHTNTPPAEPMSGYHQLRLAQILHDEPYGLGGVVLGAGRLVAVLEGLAQVGAAANPGGEVVGSHVGAAVGEIHQGKLALGVTLDFHIVAVL
jgi:hypothetical protein